MRGWGKVGNCGEKVQAVVFDGRKVQRESFQAKTRFCGNQVRWKLDSRENSHTT